MIAAEADLSLDEERSRLCAAMQSVFGNSGDDYYIYEVFDDYLIARGPGGDLYRIPYTFLGDEPKLGDAQKVTTAYVPVAEACVFLAGEAGSEDGNRFPIVVMKAGWATGAVGGRAVAHYYPPEFVKRVAESFAAGSKPFGRRHPDQRGPDPTGASDPERIAGWVDSESFDGERALAYVNLFAAESDLSAKLNEARKNKKLDLFGVSALALIGWKSGVIDSKPCLVAESLETFYSVDLCARGGAGGAFITANSAMGNAASALQSAAIQSSNTNQGGASRARHEGAAMKETLRKLLEALGKKNAVSAAGLSLKFALATEAEYPALVTEVAEALATDGTAAQATQKNVTAEAMTMLAEAQRIQSRNRVEMKLVEAKLPKPAENLARTHLESALVAEANLADAAIDAEIKGTRDAFAAFAEVGRVHAGVIVGHDSVEKLGIAMECSLGVKESMGKGIPAFKGLKQAYITITGDHDLSRLHAGGFSGHMLASEAVVTGDFPNLLLNSMTKRLLQDYAEMEIDGLEMLYDAVNIADFKLQDRVREGYFQELPIVGESNPYTEATYPTDERVNYAVQKRGNLLTVSEETIRNDDLGAIARFPGRLARAGRWTLKNYITSFFASNPAYMADAVAWFNAGHNNLGAVALSQDALIAVEIALLIQTEKDSGEPLGLSLDWLMVPPQLAATARQINQTNTAGSNAFFQRFGVNNERIIVNEKLTDDNDWYYGTKQENAPFLEIGFLDGIKQPQIFLANQPTIGTQFTADELQYKVKFVFGGAIIDYRGVGKNVVAG
jgi:hypothetical protein